MAVRKNVNKTMSQLVTSKSSRELIESIKGYNIKRMPNLHLQPNLTYLLGGSWGGRMFEMRLIINAKTEAIELTAPTYEFKKFIPHYTWDTPEKRIIRSRDLIKELVRALQASGVWSRVSNKDIIKVNTRWSKDLCGQYTSILDTWKK